MNTNQNPQKIMMAGIIALLLFLATAAWVRDIANTNRTIVQQQKEILHIIKAATQPSTQP